MKEDKILIFIVAYNAKSTLEGVIHRIPAGLHCRNVEVLVIDDCSPDSTYLSGLKWENQIEGLRVLVLRNPENHGYGGNQKLGYRYAIDNGFDVVAMVHGDGQYAPEKLPELLAPLLEGRADVVFGSRMLKKSDALKGGMPLYKWVGNQMLTAFQNRLLGTRLAEFHTGYRLYSVEALKKIPFERNANDFHFDTDIIIQSQFAGFRIVELPIPTFYGDEVCYVNGFKYAWNICASSIRGRLHLMNLFYDRKFDLGQPELNYDVKLGFPSSHTIAIAAVKPGAKVLDIGCGQGFVAIELAKSASRVVGIDQYVVPQENQAVEIKQWDLDSPSLPVDTSQFDQIFLLDIIEHLKDPETFMESLREAALSKRPEIILTTANIAFFMTRLMLCFGRFSYGRKGILDRTHTRLFTWNSLRELFEQTGYRVLEMRGIPAPFPKAIAAPWLASFLLKVNELGIALFPKLFSYQIFVRAIAMPTVTQLLSETVKSTEAIKLAGGL
ncbi:MAG: bifunctional glycosyltransferase/class I SAM-dependent methyltransferase [Verrucomicrobiota bacterium]